MDTPCSQKQKLSESWNTGEGIDIISNLEDNVLHFIFSFLPTKDAIRTSILSRRWQYLWTSISDINLDDPSSAFGKGREYGDRSFFLEFVERVLLLHDASDIKRLVLNFSLPVTSARLNSWICSAMRHNLQDLELYLPVKTHFVLPCFLFTCESLRVFKLEMDCALKPPTSVHFSHLKTLHLYLLTFVDDESTQRLFSGCPVLEELELLNCGWKNIRNIEITSPTLKNLGIDHDDMWGDVLSCVINISAPNLISLNCYTYLKVDICLRDLCSLVDASIDSFTQEAVQHVSASRLFKLVASAFNVKSLAIGEYSLDSLADIENLLNHLPTFHNLTDLTVTTEFSGWKSSRALMDVLEKSPKLKCINFVEGFCEYSTFEELHFLERVPSCVENRLETCIISGFSGKPAEFHMLRYFLKNAKKLETITLYRDDPSDKKLEEKLKNQLEMLPKGPENCLVELLRMLSALMKFPEASATQGRL